MAIGGIVHTQQASSLMGGPDDAVPTPLRKLTIHLRQVEGIGGPIDGLWL